MYPLIGPKLKMLTIRYEDHEQKTGCVCVRVVLHRLTCGVQKTVNTIDVFTPSVLAGYDIARVGNKRNRGYMYLTTQINVCVCVCNLASKGGGKYEPCGGKNRPCA